LLIRITVITFASNSKNDMSIVIHDMIDKLVTPNEKPVDLKEGAVWATHSGVMEIQGKKIRCHVLSTGQRIFDADDIESFFKDLNVSTPDE